MFEFILKSPTFTLIFGSDAYFEPEFNYIPFVCLYILLFGLNYGMFKLGMGDMNKNSYIGIFGLICGIYRCILYLD